MTALDTARSCSDCGTGLGELHADRTGDILCFRCNLRRYPDEIVEAPPEAVKTKARPLVQNGTTVPLSHASRGGGTVGHPATLRRVDVAHMLSSEPERVDWIAEGIVARGTLTLIAGREKEGKSLLAMAVAARA